MKNTTVLTIVKQQSIYRSILFGSFCLYWLLVTFCCRLILSTLFCQGCVRGQHGRGQGQGQGQGSSRPRPRPRPQNFVLEVEASPRGPPSLAFFYRASYTVYTESGYAKSSVCPSLSNSTPYCHLLCACV